MRTLSRSLTIFLSIASILPCVNASALPKEPDYPCYWQTSSGRVVDLTPSMCSSKGTTAIVPATVEQRSSIEPESSFITSYKERAKRVENVAAAKYLLAQADSSPDKLSRLGSAVCNGVIARLDRPEIVSIIEKQLPTDNQNPVLHYAGLQRISILIDMAERGDCP